jgi:Uma2 family endonuclease
MPLVMPTEDDARLGFTVEDVRAMIKAGILEGDARFELLEGEIVPMQAHNPPHMRLKRWLYQELAIGLHETHWIDSEPTFYLAGFTRAVSFTAPDIIVYAKRFSPEAVRGADCDLLIEVSDTTQKKDRGRKAKLYATHGVRDYWVADVRAEVTFVHRDPGAEGYPEPVAVPFAEPVTPLLFPHLALRMTDAP